MSVDWGSITTVFQGVGGTLILAAGAMLTWRKAHDESQDAEADRIDAHMDRQDDRIKRLECRLDASLRRERIRDDYIASLRQHIVDGKPPPPPTWPEALTLLKEGYYG